MTQIFEQCTVCGTSHSDGTKLCPACKKIRRERIRKIRADRASVGLCENCGKAPHRPERSTCESCTKDIIDRLRRLSKKRKESGICIKCGKEAAATPGVFCNRCGVISRKKLRRGKPIPSMWLYQGEQI